jgi:cell division protein FtsB
MPMRSDEQRDKSIDVLIARVQALEDEVAKLKGESLTKESASEQQNADLDASRTVIFSKPE